MPLYHFPWKLNTSLTLLSIIEGIPQLTFTASQRNRKGEGKDKVKMSAGVECTVALKLFIGISLTRKLISCFFKQRGFPMLTSDDPAVKLDITSLSLSIKPVFDCKTHKTVTWHLKCFAGGGGGWGCQESDCALHAEQTNTQSSTKFSNTSRDEVLKTPGLLGPLVRAQTSSNCHVHLC